MTGQRVSLFFALAKKKGARSPFLVFSLAPGANGGRGGYFEFVIRLFRT
jgi:hypothetical protein